MLNADPTKVSTRAKKRGLPQLGTLGAGNHYAEIQVVDEIYDKFAAGQMGIDRVGQVVVMIHCGSRGFGHQVCRRKELFEAGETKTIFLGCDGRAGRHGEGDEEGRDPSKRQTAGVRAHQFPGGSRLSQRHGRCCEFCMGQSKLDDLSG